MHFSKIPGYIFLNYEKPTLYGKPKIVFELRKKKKIFFVNYRQFDFNKAFSWTLKDFAGSVSQSKSLMIVNIPLMPLISV